MGSRPPKDKLLGRFVLLKSATKVSNSWQPYLTSPVTRIEQNLRSLRYLHLKN